MSLAFFGFVGKEKRGRCHASKHLDGWIDCDGGLCVGLWSRSVAGRAFPHHLGGRALLRERVP